MGLAGTDLSTYAVAQARASASALSTAAGQAGGTCIGSATAQAIATAVRLSSSQTLQIHSFTMLERVAGCLAYMYHPFPCGSAHHPLSFFAEYHNLQSKLFDMKG